MDSWQRVCYARHKHYPNAVLGGNDDPMMRFNSPTSMDCMEMPFNEDKESVKHHSLLGGARMSIASTVSVSGYQGINIAGIQPIYGVMLAYDEVSDALSRGPLSGNERKIAFSVSISDAQDPMSPINGNLIRDLVKGGPASSGDASLAINNYKYMVKYANEAGDDFKSIMAWFMSGNYYQ